jgi:hypothetical protein
MYFIIVLNNVEVVVARKFNLPLSNYCNNLGNEGSGGSKVGAHENLQVEGVVALVRFSTYLLQINGFQVFVEAITYSNNILLGHSWMARNALSKKRPIVGKH